jgi:hypothetical protein
MFPSRTADGLARLAFGFGSDGAGVDDDGIAGLARAQMAANHF